MSANAKNLFFMVLNFNINFLNRLFSYWIDLIEKGLIPEIDNYCITVNSQISIYLLYRPCL